MFRTILIANRGEIAIRVARTCREMGIRAVGGSSAADRDALHRRHMDESVEIGPPPARESYLRIDRVLAAAGDHVDRGAPLVVLEAMKMPNEVPAPAAGTVREVRVKEGDVVAAGAVLARISWGVA